MKQRFNGRLFVHSLKQLSSLGLLFLLATVVGTLLLVFSINLSGRGINISRFIGIACAFAYIGPVILVFQSFSFLMSRSGSDCYFSLPNTRQTLFTSNILAVFVWVVSTLIATVLALTISQPWLTDEIINGDLVIMLVITLCMAIYMMCSALMAVSLTGTWFSAVVLTGLIAFFPGWFSNVMCEGYLTVRPYLTPTTINDRWLPHNQVPIGMLLGLFEFDLGSDIYDFSSLKSLISTLVTSAIYLALAALAFTKRQSEIATRTSNSNKVRHVYRIAITTTILLALPLFGNFWDLSDTTNRSTMLFFVILALIASSGFELITTKSGKRILKAIPSFIITFVIILALQITNDKMARAYCMPEFQRYEIESVSIYNKGYEIFSEQATVPDEAIIDTVYEMHRQNMENFRQKKVGNININRNTNNICVSFNTKNESYKRNIWLDYEENGELAKKLLESQSFRKSLYEMPDVNTITEFSLYGVEDQEKCKEIYIMLQKEMESFCLKQAEGYKEVDLFLLNRSDAIYYSEEGEERLLDGQSVNLNYTVAFENTLFFKYKYLNGLFPKTMQGYSKALEEHYQSLNQGSSIESIQRVNFYSMLTDKASEEFMRLFDQYQYEYAFEIMHNYSLPYTEDEVLTLLKELAKPVSEEDTTCIIQITSYVDDEAVQYNRSLDKDSVRQLKELIELKMSEGEVNE